MSNISLYDLPKLLNVEDHYLTISDNGEHYKRVYKISYEDETIEFLIEGGSTLKLPMCVIASLDEADNEITISTLKAEYYLKLERYSPEEIQLSDIL